MFFNLTKEQKDRLEAQIKTAVEGVVMFLDRVAESQERAAAAQEMRALAEISALQVVATSPDEIGTGEIRKVLKEYAQGVEQRFRGMEGIYAEGNIVIEKTKEADRGKRNA